MNFNLIFVKEILSATTTVFMKDLIFAIIFGIGLLTTIIDAWQVWRSDEEKRVKTIIYQRDLAFAAIFFYLTAQYLQNFLS